MGGRARDTPPGPAPLDLSLAAELRELDVFLYDPPVAPPRVPLVVVPESTDEPPPQRLTLGFADRRARARFLGRCTSEVAERCRGGASAACALAVARYGDEDDNNNKEEQQQQQQGGGARGVAAPAAAAAAAETAAPTAKRRPWWARMLLLPGPRREREAPPSSRPRARCEAEAARACHDHARQFCRAVLEEADDAARGADGGRGAPGTGRQQRRR